MSLIFPRTIKIVRPYDQKGVGTLGYGGMSQNTERLIIENVPAAIQQKSISRQLSQKLPGDIRAKTLWRILFKLPHALIEDRDIVVAENGERFQITSSYWTPIMYNCLSERLEV